MINKYSSNYASKEYASFNSFISINSNQIAKSTAIEFAVKETSYNVLGITSSVGNGATYLALAILNEIERKETTKEIFYLSFERLLHDNYFINNLNTFNTDFFNSKSLILIDSFYNSSNKLISNQLFNILNNVKTKIIFTYNQGVKIPIVKKEIYLDCPSKIEKEIIIKNILKALKENFSSEVISYISDQNNLSIRKIEGLIICILAKSALGNCIADIEFVKNIHNRMINFN